jgi:hypothetical protein
VHVMIDQQMVVFRPIDQTEKTCLEIQSELVSLGIDDLFRVRHRCGKIQVGRPRHSLACSNHWTLMGDEKKLSLYGTTRGKHVRLDKGQGQKCSKPA